MTSMQAQATPETSRSSDDEFTVVAVHAAPDAAQTRTEEEQINDDLARFEAEIAQTDRAVTTVQPDSKLDDDLNDVELALEEDAREQRLQEDLQERVKNLRKRLHENASSMYQSMDATPESDAKPNGNQKESEAEGKRIRKAARRISWRERVLRIAHDDSDGELQVDDGTEEEENDGVRRRLHP